MRQFEECRYAKLDPHQRQEQVFDNPPKLPIDLMKAECPVLS
jgi:hypothetical protein